MALPGAQILKVHFQVPSITGYNALKLDCQPVAD